MAVSFKSEGLSARSLGILADRARNFLLGPGMMRVMGEAGVDLARRQQALIDSRTLKPLSQSRKEQRVRHHVPFGPDWPLKATGQLHRSIAGGARRSGAEVAAVAFAKATRRVPEERVGDAVAAEGLDAEGAFLEGQFREQRARRRRRLRARSARRGTPRARGMKQPSNAELVRFHRATGRDITQITPDFVARWRATIFERLRAAILSGRTT